MKIKRLVEELANVKCPLCTNSYNDKIHLYSHLDKKHNDQLNGLSPAQFYFNNKYKKSGGKCIMCQKSTKWNEATERYERICDRKETNCREKYREMFRKRMQGKYGKDTLLDDPEHQKKMLENRKISGVYKWQDGGESKYTGSYEKDFLEFLDTFLQFNSSDIMCPAPQTFDYLYEGKPHFYIPDFYISSMNLIIEIKSAENKHYRERDIGKEKLKDRAVLKSKFNYLKITDKQYDEFFDFLLTFKK